MDSHFSAILNEQRQYFAGNATLPIAFRIEQLQKLKSLIKAHETKIVTALNKDLHKSATEAVLNEILLVTEEINFICRHLKKWSRPTKVPTPFPALWPGKSAVHYQPYGSVLIIGPWNYPFLLVMSPLIGAICAGNCAIIKPSEIASYTQDVIFELINRHFPSQFIAAVKAGPEEMPTLLQEKFDYVFFTGGTQIGRIVMEACAKHLTPLTLELGGKNPCIIDQTANLAYAARRVAWAKTTNAGQVCLAPDYLYVHRSQKEAFVTHLKHVLKQFFGADPRTSSSFGRIINQKHFDRLVKLISKGTILEGGMTKADELYIAPTLIEDITWDDPIMQEEIFGPILPILTYEHIDEVIKIIKSHPKPLALYVFTHSKNIEEKVISQLSFGGGCVNDCILQVANVYLPFGGIGWSGMGQYHGKFSFETFSHRKALYKKNRCIDLKLEYPPHSEKKLNWLRWLFKF